MSRSARAAILAEIRRALEAAAGAPSKSRAEALSSHASARATLEPAVEDLWAELRQELDSLGASGYLASTWEEAARRVLFILGQSKAELVSLGPGKRVESLRTHLATPSGASTALRYLEWDAAPGLAAQAEAGVVEAEMAIAATGSIVLDTGNGLLSSLLPPALIALVPRRKIVPNLTSAMARLASAGCAGGRITLVTGPSRTADIEKKLVLGVHGPKELAVLVLEGDASAS